MRLTEQASVSGAKLRVFEHKQQPIGWWWYNRRQCSARQTSPQSSGNWAGNWRASEQPEGLYLLGNGGQKISSMKLEIGAGLRILDGIVWVCNRTGKRNILKIERRNLNFRTWIKRLARKTICFSKLEKMHDIVIGLLINKVEFGKDIYTAEHVWTTTNRALPRRNGFQRLAILVLDRE